MRRENTPAKPGSLLVNNIYIDMWLKIRFVPRRVLSLHYKINVKSVLPRDDR